MSTVNPALSLIGRPLRAIEHWITGPVDARAYGAVRIASALVAASLWIDLWPLRETLLTDTGSFYGPAESDQWRLNVFQWVSSTSAVTAVFAVTALAIVALGLGVWQRVSAIVVYVWSTSYCVAAGLALGGFDTVARLTSFAVAVSPTVAAFSIAKPKPGAATDVPAYGLRILQWQLMLIYWVTFWLKSPDRYWRAGEVVSHFGVSMFARSPDPKFADIGIWDPLLTWGTLLIEVSMPVLLWKRATRWLGLGLGLCLHGAIAVLGELALFSVAMLPLYLAFLERHDFEAATELLRRFRARTAR